MAFNTTCLKGPLKGQGLRCRKRVWRIGKKEPKKFLKKTQNTCSVFTQILSFLNFGRANFVFAQQKQWHKFQPCNLPLLWTISSPQDLHVFLSLRNVTHKTLDLDETRAQIAARDQHSGVHVSPKRAMMHGAIYSIPANSESNAAKVLPGMLIEKFSKCSQKFWSLNQSPRMLVLFHLQNSNTHSAGLQQLHWLSLAVLWGKKLGGLHVYLDCSRRTAEMNLLVWVLRLKKAKSWKSPGPHYKSWYNHSVYKCSINHSPTMVYSPPWVLSTVQGPQPSTVAAFAPLFQSLEMSDSDQTHAFRSWICEKSATNKYLGVNNSAQKGKTWLVLKNTWPFLVKKNMEGTSEKDGPGSQYVRPQCLKPTCAEVVAAAFRRIAFHFSSLWWEALWT